MAKKNVLKLKIAKIINEIQTEREKRKVYDQARYKVNREKILADSRAYYKANKEKRKVYDQAKYKIKRDVEILNKKGEELC